MSRKAESLAHEQTSNVVRFRRWRGQNWQLAGGGRHKANPVMAKHAVRLTISSESSAGE